MKTTVSRFLLVLMLLASCLLRLEAQAKRVVVFKVDGLSPDLLERVVNEADPLTGESRLPWIKRLFYERGTRLTNFYVRGISLSAPSWSLLDTGAHQQIKGNVEYDRYTLQAYDYLNFFPFYLNYARSRQADKVGAEVLDAAGVPLLMDAWASGERSQSFQLYQRGVNLELLGEALPRHLKSRSVSETLGELAAGFDSYAVLTEQIERELIARLQDPRVRYLDYFTDVVDRAVHASRELAAHRLALRQLDAAVGRVWTAIEGSPLAAETLLVLVSDHGLNSDEQIYSQGFNLVAWFGSRAGGGHHVVTSRHPLSSYQLKGLNPFVSTVVTPSAEAGYLTGQAEQYPTALLDLDGNERASIYLRNSDLNLLHLLLRQLQRRDLPPAVRSAATAAFFQVIERKRPAWSSQMGELAEELAAIRRKLSAERLRPGKRKLTEAELKAGQQLEERRAEARLTTLAKSEQDYRAYLETLSALLSLHPSSVATRRIKENQIIAPRAMGEPNTIGQLQNYVAGLAPGGLCLRPDHSLDWQRSFVRLDYFALLSGLQVNNNVQARVSTHPVDFVAARVPLAAILPALSANLKSPEWPDQDAVWLYQTPERQALVLARRDERGNCGCATCRSLIWTRMKRAGCTGERRSGELDGRSNYGRTSA